MSFPVFHGGIGPLDTKGRGRVMAIDVPVRCAGVKVASGDLIFGDADGVVVVPRAIEDEVLALAFDKIKGEKRTLDDLRAGREARRRVRQIRDPSGPMPFRCDQPAVPTVQQDDATVRITRWDFAPGAATGWHTHGWPYFVVMLTDAVMKIEAAGAVSEVRLDRRAVLSAAGRHRARRDERLGPADGVRRDRDQAAGGMIPKSGTGFRTRSCQQETAAQIVQRAPAAGA